ncbi:MAG: hypothetical protein KF886_02120 [Candidatus Hydrogenedentes bacterium]|nr:hypothetical protein [Candidatus Hydrogenedentota bacterium]
MGKVLQWSVAILVSITLLAIIGMQMLARHTAHSRDQSVGALREKLAQFEDAPPRDGGNASSESPRSGTDSAAPISTPDIEALRAGWQALAVEADAMLEPCELPEGIWVSVVGAARHVEDGALSAVERERLLAFQACRQPYIDEVMALVRCGVDMDTVFDMPYLLKRLSAFDGPGRASWVLQRRLWISAALEDHGAVLDAFYGLVYLNGFRFRGLPGYWSIGDYSNWELLRPAIESELASGPRGDALFDLLSHHRNPGFFRAQVRLRAAEIIESYETWNQRPMGFAFREAPVAYFRNWAYPRLTPALFNHDLDRFSRATAELLDLVALPYAEAEPRLASFYEKFDVEPNVSNIKVMRSNSGWYFVVQLSRHDLPNQPDRWASMDIIRLAMLLERHKRADGAYPDSLEVFAGEFGGAVPRNPYLDAPYVYELADDAYQLGYTRELGYEREYVRDADPLVITHYWHDPYGLASDMDPYGEPEDGEIE